jgi:hypothetical protein
MMKAQQPRFVPVSCDLRALGMRKGDLLAVVPLDRFRGDAIYMISAEGAPLPFRCTQDRDGCILLRSLDPRGGSVVMTETEFGEVLLGQVLATCKVLDPSLLEHTR